MLWEFAGRVVLLEVWLAVEVVCGKLELVHSGECGPFSKRPKTRTSHCIMTGQTGLSKCTCLYFDSLHLGARDQRKLQAACPPRGALRAIWP
jgi:hypothetical protein